MAGKLRHFRFNDDTWDAWCATLPEGVSPTQGLEALMRACLGDGMTRRLRVERNKPEVSSPPALGGSAPLPRRQAWPSR